MGDKGRIVSRNAIRRKSRYNKDLINQGKTGHPSGNQLLFFQSIPC